MRFRYHRDPRAGWRVSPEGAAPAAVEAELTSGALRLSGFSPSLPVVGHLHRDGSFCVLYKARDRKEIEGERLSRSEYERHGFDPFVAVSELFDAAFPEAREPTEAGGGPWPAEGDDYLAHAAVLFRRLPESERSRDYLSALPRDVAPSAFPNTCFIQTMKNVPTAPRSAHPEPPPPPPPPHDGAFERLSDRVRRDGQGLRRLEEEVRDLRRAYANIRQTGTKAEISTSQGTGSDTAPVETPDAPRRTVAHRLLPWAPAGVAAFLLLSSLVFLAASRQDIRDIAEDASDAAKRSVDDAATFAEAAKGEAGKAEKSASAAENSGRTAEEASGAAKRSADDAATFAEAAKGEAGKAEKSASAAENSGRTAEEASGAAKRSADDAATFAEAAKGEAGKAEKSASAAENSSRTAEEASGAAKRSAIDAATSAEAAKDEADRTTKSATDSAESAEK